MTNNERMSVPATPENADTIRISADVPVAESGIRSRQSAQQENLTEAEVVALRGELTVLNQQAVEMRSRIAEWIKDDGLAMAKLETEKLEELEDRIEVIGRRIINATDAPVMDRQDREVA